MSDKKITGLLEWRENVPEGRLVNPGIAPFDVLDPPNGRSSVPLLGSLNSYVIFPMSRSTLPVSFSVASRLPT
jgi:hypothetical protein